MGYTESTVHVRGRVEQMNGFFNDVIQYVREHWESGEVGYMKMFHYSCPNSAFLCHFDGHFDSEKY